jgi:transcriptional regulator of acetoin/glycerol metabolism
MAEDASLPEIHLDQKVEDVLHRYHWPGNIRELSNVLERVLSSLEGNTIRLPDLPFYLYKDRKDAPKSRRTSMKAAQARAEKEAILDALRKADHNKAQAARILGIHRTHLYKKMKKHGIANSFGQPV